MDARIKSGHDDEGARRELKPLRIALSRVAALGEGAPPLGRKLM
jgi:hypothetical protein